MILPNIASVSKHRCQRVAIFLREIRHSAPVVTGRMISSVKKTGIIFLTFTA